LAQAVLPQVLGECPRALVGCGPSRPVQPQMKFVAALVLLAIPTSVDAGPSCGSFAMMKENRADDGKGSTPAGWTAKYSCPTGHCMDAAKFCAGDLCTEAEWKAGGACCAAVAGTDDCCATCDSSSSCAMMVSGGGASCYVPPQGKGTSLPWLAARCSKAKIGSTTCFGASGTCCKGAAAPGPLCLYSAAMACQTASSKAQAACKSADQPACGCKVYDTYFKCYATATKGCTGSEIAVTKTKQGMTATKTATCGADGKAGTCKGQPVCATATKTSTTASPAQVNTAGNLANGLRTAMAATVASLALPLMW